MNCSLHTRSSRAYRPFSAGKSSNRNASLTKFSSLKYHYLQRSTTAKGRLLGESARDVICSGYSSHPRADDAYVRLLCERAITAYLGERVGVWCGIEPKGLGRIRYWERGRKCCHDREGLMTRFEAVRYDGHRRASYTNIYCWRNQSLYFVVILLRSVDCFQAFIHEPRVLLRPSAIIAARENHELTPLRAQYVYRFAAYSGVVVVRRN